MSLKHIEELSQRKSFENLIKIKNDPVFLPAIEKKTPKIQNAKSASLISNSDNKNNGLKNYMANPEIFYKEINYKLVVQKNEIDKRNEMITMLQNNFNEIKINYLKEKNENLERIKQIQTLKQIISNLELEKESVLKISKQTENNETIQKLMKENENLTNLLSYKEAENLKKEEIIKGYIKMENELANLKKELELMHLHNTELKNFLQHSQDKNKSLEIAIKENEENYNNQKKLYESEMSKLEERFQEKIKENEHIYTEQNFNKLSEIQRLKTEIMDLNYQIRQKDLSIIEMKRNTNNLYNEKILSLQEEIKKEKNISKELTSQLEDLQAKYNQINNEIDKGKKNDYENFETQLSMKFKNINEEIKTLKKKIDGNIENHINKKPLTQQPNHNSLNSLQEKANQLTQINKSLTSFIVILQNRLQKYEKDVMQEEISSNKLEENIIKNFSCGKCQQLLKQAVTCIPCGHSFCKECKSAYTEFCIECGQSNGDVEAVYRNELIDDLIKLVQLLPYNPNSKLKQKI